MQEKIHPSIVVAIVRPILLDILVILEKIHMNLSDDNLLSIVLPPGTMSCPSARIMTDQSVV